MPLFFLAVQLDPRPGTFNVRIRSRVYPVYRFFQSEFWNATVPKCFFPLVKTIQRSLLPCLFCVRLHRRRGPWKDRKEAAGRPDARPPVLCYFSEELFPRWDGEGARDSAPAPAAIQLLLLLLLPPLLPLLLLLLLHQNHFSFSSHPEVNNPDSTITAYV